MEIMGKLEERMSVTFRVCFCHTSQRVTLKVVIISAQKYIVANEIYFIDF